MAIDIVSDGHDSVLSRRRCGCQEATHGRFARFAVVPVRDARVWWLVGVVGSATMP